MPVLVPLDAVLVHAPLVAGREVVPYPRVPLVKGVVNKTLGNPGGRHAAQANRRVVVVQVYLPAGEHDAESRQLYQPQRHVTYAMMPKAVQDCYEMQQS